MSELKNFQPTLDRVLVRPVEKETETPGVIQLPDIAKSRQTQGVVVAVGPGRIIDGIYNEPDLDIGDTVLYSAYAGTEIELDDEVYLILREDDILGRWPGDGGDLPETENYN